MPSSTHKTTDAQTVQAFKDAVNMTPKELERWLDSQESQSVGQTHSGEHEAVGHQSGKKIIQILNKSDQQLTEEDLVHMRKVVSYVHRHMAQGPEHDVESSRWRYSLMNWGHDPLKKRS